MGVIEGLRIVQADGLDPRVTHEAISQGAASSWMLAHLGRKILDGDFLAGFSIRLQHKDLTLASELIADLAEDCPGTQLISHYSREQWR